MKTLLVIIAIILFDIDAALHGGAQSSLAHELDLVGLVVILVIAAFVCGLLNLLETSVENLKLRRQRKARPQQAAPAE